MKANLNTKLLARNLTKVLTRPTPWDLTKQLRRLRILPSQRMFLVHGLKRSGNHAIINWLQAHFQIHETSAIQRRGVSIGSHFIFFNDIVDINRILKGAPLRSENLNNWLQGKGISRRTRWGRSLIMSLEDHDPGFRPFSNLEDINVTNILILRDPRNLFSSRIRKASLVSYPCYQLTESSIRRAVSLWKEHAREYLGLTNHLANAVCIYFDTWFADPVYRRRIGQQLGLKFTDDGFSKVTNYGGGSSFDGTSLDGTNQKMNVLGRHNSLTSSERRILIRILKDEELTEFHNLIAKSSDM